MLSCGTWLTLPYLAFDSVTLAFGRSFGLQTIFHCGGPRFNCGIWKKRPVKQKLCEFIIVNLGISDVHVTLFSSYFSTAQRNCKNANNIVLFYTTLL